MQDLSLNLSSLGMVLMFATLNESLIEYFFGSTESLRPYLPTLALFCGIFLAVIYNINLFSLFFGFESMSSIVDNILSGFIISRGSNFVNDFARKALGSK